MRKIVSALILGAAAPAALAGASIAQASPAAPGAATVKPALDYRWCPGDRWDDHWGINWDFGNCHDEHFRYDHDWHRHDEWGGPHW